MASIACQKREFFVGVVMVSQSSQRIVCREHPFGGVEIPDRV